MTTAALLPTPGDPYLIEHWLRNFEQVWQGEVDELRVLVNMQPIPEVREWIRGRVEARGGIYMETDQQPYGHGYALGVLIDATDADYVMLCEDDCRVRHTGAVADRVERLERGEADVIGGPRTSMTPGVSQAAAKRFPVNRDILALDGGQGHGLWPAFVFARRECLLDTDRNFGTRAWSKGERVEALDWVCPEDDKECADTFGWAALQLRARYHVESDVHYKGPWMWQHWLDEGRDIPWFHIGSLSSSANLCEGEQAELMDGKPCPPRSHESGEWASRLYWWQRCFRTCRIDLPWGDAYAAGWERLREVKAVHREEIQKWAAVADRLVTWDERRTA